MLADHRPASFTLPLVAALGLVTADPGLARPVAAQEYTLTVLDRTVAQDRVPQDKSAQEQKWFWQSWQIDYQLKLEGPTGLVVVPSEIKARVEGWVSNSRVPSHAVPRLSALNLAGSSGLAATADLIEAGDESQRCRERAALLIETGDEAGVPETSEERTDAQAADRPILSLAPGGTLRVRLQLVHQHFLYGMYDPLLGRRAFTLRLGPAALTDSLPLDREHHVAQAASTWNNFPDDRRDPHQFVSPPDSLHLEAHVPGNQYFRFPEQPVRYDTKMRLRFWYLVAPGTEGDCKARIAQYKDTPTTWKVLSDGGFEECLSVVGRWVHVERIFVTQAEATTLALDFRIAGAEVGELWIDDVSLEPIGGGPEGP